MYDGLNSLPCGYVSFDDLGRILAVNTTLLDLLGYERDELEGGTLESLLPPGGRVFYQMHLFPLLKLRGMAEEVYLVLKAKDGADVPVLTYGSRRDDVNECMFIRVTRREQYLEDAARMRELLIGVLGHDLRVPMTAVAFGAEQLLHDETLSPKGQRTAMAILASAKRAARMTADLLDYTRVRFAGGIPVQRGPADLRLVVEKVIAELSAIYPSVSIDFRVDGDCRGSWDADRAAQVVANLLANAIEHGIEGAPVSVTLDEVGDAVALEVRNTAAAESTTSGLGLGLYVSREVVQAHGGSLDIAADDGVFTVRAVWPKS